MLPAAWGWHDPVGMLLRLREAGCWAAVALQLELSGNGPEAASATLHGVVAYLRVSWGDSACSLVSSWFARALFSRGGLGWLIVGTESE